MFIIPPVLSCVSTHRKKIAEKIRFSGDERKMKEVVKAISYAATKIMFESKIVYRKHALNAANNYNMKHYNFIYNSVITNLIEDQHGHISRVFYTPPIHDSNNNTEIGISSMMNIQEAIIRKKRNIIRIISQFQEQESLSNGYKVIPIEYNMVFNKSAESSLELIYYIRFIPRKEPRETIKTYIDKFGTIFHRTIFNSTISKIEQMFWNIKHYTEYEIHFYMNTVSPIREIEDILEGVLHKVERNIAVVDGIIVNFLNGLINKIGYYYTNLFPSYRIYSALKFWANQVVHICGLCIRYFQIYIFFDTSSWHQEKVDVMIQVYTDILKYVFQAEVIDIHIPDYKSQRLRSAHAHIAFVVVSKSPDGNVHHS